MKTRYQAALPWLVIIVLLLSWSHALTATVRLRKLPIKASAGAKVAVGLFDGSGAVIGPCRPNAQPSEGAQAKLPPGQHDPSSGDPATQPSATITCGPVSSPPCYSCLACSLYTKPRASTQDCPYLCQAYTCTSTSNPTCCSNCQQTCGECALCPGITTCQTKSQ